MVLPAPIYVGAHKTILLLPLRNDCLSAPIILF